MIFTQPDKFISLIPQGEFLNRFYQNDYYSEDVIYINDNFSFEFGDYNCQKIKSSPIIILRDEFGKAELLNCIDDDFYILRHGNNPVLIESLYNLTNCKGTIQQQEEEKFNGVITIYYKLAQKIASTPTNTAIDFIKENFVTIAKSKNKLNAALEFLHECLGGQVADTDILIKNGFTISQELNLKIGALTSKVGSEDSEYNKALADVRDLLLVEEAKNGEK